ncbi:tetratricopeptide repeat-containing sulfotransferase family protein [Sphingomicrobium sediminis]|uniref:Tetratricopeptide repeat protein n=1 Tax=Sphingomicrobium sediminis TaxID=2950949 RepID=A0A9X2EJ44_9SPHN|nr:tetratricopeptide repeat-containing sulfotransferase family protein [Sphingomicrobium sediminis]MCM8556202.1 tetratricopeptide repeat protein [Sphingomicrobium sediminis]
MNKTTTKSKKAPGSKAAAAKAAAAKQAAAKKQAEAAPVEDVGQAIDGAQQGKVNVTPLKAVEMAGTLYAQGKLDQAERVCRQILAARPGMADAHNILGVTLHAAGKQDGGLESVRKAIKIQPKAATFHANLGELLRQRGELDEAKAALEKSIELDANNAQAHNNLGIIAYDQRRFKEAVKHYGKALEIRPEMAEALNNKGNALRILGKNDEAIEAYQDALTYREIYPEAYNNLGTLLQAKGQQEEAEHAMRKAIQQSPQYIEARNNLAGLYAAQNKDVDALRILSETLKFAPQSVPTLVLTARIQMRRNAHQAAEQALRFVVGKEPEHVEALTMLGQLLHETDRYDEAIEVLEKALSINADHPEARNFYGIALKSVGRLDEAREHILGALAKNPNLVGAYANLNDLVNFKEEDELFQKMDHIMKNAKNKQAPGMLPLHFAYGKALADRGEHEKALEHYIIGGKMKRAQLDYVEEETHGFFDQIREAFPADVFKNRKFEGLSDDRLVFIVGMPRSGSTLTEQIISTHKDVYGAGEVKFFSQSLGRLRDRFPSLPKFPMMMEKITPKQMEILGNTYLKLMTAGSGDAKRVTDKLLTNFFFVGLIHLLYPNAKIINTQRDPVDTCLSGFTKLFKDDMPHSYDLNELGRYYAKYQQLMDHWNKVLPKGVLHTSQYEKVVDDIDTEAKKLIDFIGLDWDPNCLKFYESKRPVKTASVAQVRKPIYKSSVKRWKRYGDGLQPLVDAINAKPAS